MQHLKCKLKGEAGKLIQHLKVTADNYQKAWDILMKRYNHQKLILNSHFDTIMSLPSMQAPSTALIKKIHDTTVECINAIEALGIDTSPTVFSSFLVYIIGNKLDSVTHNEYSLSLENPRDPPVLSELLSFLERKFTAAESSKRKGPPTKVATQPEPVKTKPYFYKSFTSKTEKNEDTEKQLISSSLKCPVCKKQHGIFYCNTFLGMHPKKRSAVVEKLLLCRNCLKYHGKSECWASKCRECDGDHNTLLHETNAIRSKKSSLTSNDIQVNVQNKQANHTHVSQGNTSEILLATALVNIEKSDGSYVMLRALIDQGSQTSLITENAAQLLGLKRNRCKGVIFGVGARENNCKGVISITLSSLLNNYKLKTDVFIMKNLINNLPNKSFEKPSWPYIENIQLADPEYYKSRPVDLLLGADIYSSIIMSGIIRENEYQPVAQQTLFGWILCGNTNTTQSYHCNVVLINDEDYSRFWSIEDIAENETMSTEDQHCMQLYKNTTTRRPDGKYTVRLPLHPDIHEKLGQSKHRAMAQFYQLERKFKKQSNVASQYKDCISEYINLGHMQLATPSINDLSYYLPHHCVQRAESTTTALRVVFNGSQASSSGHSLNDLMYRGPNLQQDIVILILKWRQYEYAFTADIEKCFRQIFVHPDDQAYQKIVWRDTPTKLVQDYQLTTVTYGTKAAPFLTMMTLKQLASDEINTYPEAAKALQNQFYMDDYLGGSFSVEEGKQLQSDLKQLLNSGGFNLRKWRSNNPELCQTTSKQQTYDFTNQESTKALGLTWNAKDDIFSFKCKLTNMSEVGRLTKRVLLSEISKIFDPLGWLAPCVIQLKILFQKVWTEDLKWDDDVPEKIKQEWGKIKSKIDDINRIH